MAMASETTIPLLPCPSITEILAFYGALGFEVTYQQTAPNSYACVRRGGIELHFFSMKGFEPANSYGSCLVLVPDADELYKAFAAGLRQRYGKLPVSGIPRMTPLRNKAGNTRGFNVIDLGGNWIRVVQQLETPAMDGEPDQSDSSLLSRALHAADLLTHSKGDYATAAKVLDKALMQDETVPSVLRLKALVLRAELAANLGDQALASTMLADARQVPLDVQERAMLSEELQRASDLEQTLK